MSSLSDTPESEPVQRPGAELTALARRVDIRSVVAALAPEIRELLRRDGRQLRAIVRPPTRPKITCPFHDDHNPSLELDVNRNRWICRACPATEGERGSNDTIDLVQRVRSCSFTQARDWLVELAGRDDIPLADLERIALPATTEPDNRRLEAATRVLERIVATATGASARLDDWARRRGLPDDLDLSGDVVAFNWRRTYHDLERRFDTPTLRRAGVLTEQDKALLYRRDALIIFRDPDGRPVWAQGFFTTPPAPRPDGTRPVKYLGLSWPAPWPFGAEHAAVGGRRLVVCEGAIDALSVRGHLDIPSIGLPGAKPWVPKSWAKLLQRWQRLVLAHDPDPAGDGGAGYFVEAIERHGLRWRYSRWAAPWAGADLNDSLRNGTLRLSPPGPEPDGSEP
jgi:hypothetical protein